MANVNEYLIWRGDLPFNKNYPFNEIDSLILARFSYLVFNEIKMKPEETVESISNKMRDIPNEDFLYNGDKELIERMGGSIRFKDLIVTDHVANSDKTVEQQFGAITIHISNKEMYVSYLGTDSSINGWKEDFNMMFLDDVPCQLDGKKYLEKVAKKYPEKDIRVGGHSKGGNIAVYSSVSVSEDIQKRIIKVYNYDGPGLRKEVLKRYNMERILPKIQTYIPQDSVIGLLLYHKEKMLISKSIEKGILQHDIFSWQVLKDDLIHLETNTESSAIIDETITQWFEETTNEQRKIVVNAIFDLFYSTENETFEEIGENLPSSIAKMLKNYNDISQEDKKMIALVINKMFALYVKTASIKEHKKIKTRLNKVRKSLI